MKDATPNPVQVVAFYVGSSLLTPLRRAESEIREHGLELRLAAHNGGAPWSDPEWEAALADLARADLVLIMHLTDSENSRRLLEALDRFRHRHHGVIVFNCLADLMGRTRMGKLDLGRLMATLKPSGRPGPGLSLALRLGTWMSELMSRRSSSRSGKGARSGAGRFHAYHKLAGRLPRILKFVPGAGKLKDIKNYLILYCHFLQPTPRNVRSMLLHAIKHYVPGHGSLAAPDPPEVRPSTGLYHPLAPDLFESFAAYRDWYQAATGRTLDPQATVGLLLMRPQIVGDARRHYDGLIQAIESEGLSVVAAISTFMDNREACRAYFLEDANGAGTPAPGGGEGSPRPRVSQIVSLTGFSFVGGPVMNDTEASVSFLGELGIPFRSLVSLDLQTIENWEQSRVGLNPVQTAMQVAIPELDGATESRLYGGGVPKEPPARTAVRALSAHRRQAGGLEPPADCSPRQAETGSGDLLLSAQQGEPGHGRRSGRLRQPAGAVGPAPVRGIRHSPTPRPGGPSPPDPGGQLPGLGDGGQRCLPDAGGGVPGPLSLPG